MLCGHCGSYRGIELLESAVSGMEGIFKHRILQQIDIDDMQFGSVKGTSLWYRLTRVVPDRVQRGVNGCVCLRQR